jgi:tetratricopeptide (TPR) repeat protein
MRYLYVFISLSFLFASIESFSQNQENVSKRAARGYFKYNNYRQALEEYKKLLQTDSTNIEYNYNIGLCYLYTNINKAKAIPYFEFVVKQSKAPAQAWYDLGRAYHLQYEFDKAIESYKTFSNLVSKDDNYIPTARQIEMCQNAKVLTNLKNDVKFEHLTGDINSEGPDYNPYIIKDESMLIFTSKRQGNIGGYIDFDGYNTPNIFFSQNKDGIWQKVRRFPNTINSPFIEESVGLSSDGTYLFTYIDNFYVSGDIYYAMQQGRGYSRLQPLGANVNTRYLETSAAIAPNKRILFFAANYPDSYGGLDLYYSVKLPNGTWGAPVNLGQTINTPYDEEYPYISSDGAYLYFASTGHNSMGGYDIFKSKWDKENMTFSKPENLGYPVNTPDDETVISFTQSGRFAYMSRYMVGNKGDLDIYRLTFNDVNPATHSIIGRVFNSEQDLFFNNYIKLLEQRNKLREDIDSLFLSGKYKDSLNLKKFFPEIIENYSSINEQISSHADVEISVYSQSDNSLFGTYRPNRSTSKFVILLPYGKYKIEIQSEGYKTHVFTLNLKDIETGEIIEDKMIVMEKEN